MVPIIDRELLPDRLGKVRKHSSWVPILAAVLVAVLMLGAVAGFMVQIGNNKERPQSETPARVPAGILYTMHSPISITGNKGFKHINGVSAGTGTASDPYIIADWDINASTADGISINDTDAYFIVRNCYVHDGGSSYPGIDLLRGSNGTLENNTCSNDLVGIYLSSSSNNKLINNSCPNGLGGIGLDYSNNNTLVSNTCSLNTIDDIGLSSSSNNTLSNNNCSLSDDDGIYLYFSSNNTLSNNTCSSNDYAGIALDSSSNAKLVNNTCDSNIVGISLSFWSNNTEISQNHICNNAGYGMFIDSGSSLNRIWNNTFIGNNGATDTYSASHVQAYDEGTNNWNNSGTPHGYGNYWSDWTTPDANHDGIVDVPYNIIGSAAAKDYYPLTTVQTQIPEFGMLPLVVIALIAVIVLAGETRRRKRP